jgi:hypothetical protein
MVILTKNEHLALSEFAITDSVFQYKYDGHVIEFLHFGAARSAAREVNQKDAQVRLPSRLH